MPFLINRDIKLNHNYKNETVANNVFSSLCWGNEKNPNMLLVTSKNFTYLYNTATGEIQDSFYFNGTEKNACDIEPIDNELIASAGYDGSIHIGKINTSTKKKNIEEFTKKFPGHQGAVTNVRFLNRTYLLSSSRDSLIYLWDINSEGKHISMYHDHTSEVSALDVNERDSNIFITGSGDMYAKIFDLRIKNACVATFKGSESTVNCVKFMPGKFSTFVAGSEDSEIRLYDIRALGTLAVFNQKDEFNSINSIDFSNSGELIFATSDNKNCIYVWDIFLQSEAFDTFELVTK